MFVFIAYFLHVISHCNACVDCMKHGRNLPWKTEHPDNDLPENQKTEGFMARHKRQRGSEEVADWAGHVPVWCQLSLISSQ